MLLRQKCGKLRQCGRVFFPVENYSYLEAKPQHLDITVNNSYRWEKRPALMSKKWGFGFFRSVQFSRSHRKPPHRPVQLQFRHRNCCHPRQRPCLGCRQPCCACPRPWYGQHCLKAELAM